MAGFGWIRGVVTGKLWVRASLYGLIAVAAAMLSRPLAPILPGWLTEWVEEDAIRDLLEIIASSMLLVATFSLGTMAAAYNAAATIATPRASKVLIDDPISQSVLATFIGAFVFAMVALVCLSLGYYDDQGRTLLLIATIAVVAAVIVTIFGWVDYLANLLRLGAVLSKLEEASREAIEARRRAPFLGARPEPDSLPAGHGIRVDETGYVTEIDLSRLDAIAARHGGTIRVAAVPGTLVGRHAPVAYADFSPDPDEIRALPAAFKLAAERSITQDPRYGLIVLAEVASRALSPGVNDPGTAIGVLGRLQRLLNAWAEPVEATPAVGFPHVELPGITADDLLADAFGPIARDGAPIFEVGVRLQKSLAVLAGLGRPDLASAACFQSARALAQAEGKLPLASDRAELARLAAAVSEAAASS